MYGDKYDEIAWKVLSGQIHTPELSTEMEEERIRRMKGKKRDNGHTGMKRSLETRVNISEATKGKRLGNQNAAKCVIIDGVTYPSSTAAGEALGVHRSTVIRRIRRHLNTNVNTTNNETTVSQAEGT